MDDSIINCSQYARGLTNGLYLGVQKVFYLGLTLPQVRAFAARRSCPDAVRHALWRDYCLHVVSMARVMGYRVDVAPHAVRAHAAHRDGRRAVAPA